MSQGNEAEVLPSRGNALRRNLIKTGIFASLISSAPRLALAADPDPRDHGDAAMPLKNAGALLEAFAVTQVILRERAMRERHDFDAEDACFLPDAPVEVSWFKGTAREFTDSARKAAAAGRRGDLSFDSMSPAFVEVNRSRALADTSCAIHSFVSLSGVEASMTSYTRLLWQSRRMNGEWRIAGLHAVYIRDTLEPTDPAEVLKIDVERLKRYRPSYRHLSYIHEATGRAMRSDLPGVDQPETVAALRASQRDWLAQASNDG